MDSRTTRGPDQRAVLGAFRAHRTNICQGCGAVLRHLETRHSVDGAVFHTECVPGRGAAAEEPEDRAA
jgi:hypothetical protein